MLTIGSDDDLDLQLYAGGDFYLTAWKVNGEEAVEGLESI